MKLRVNVLLASICLALSACDEEQAPQASATETALQTDVHTDDGQRVIGAASLNAKPSSGPRLPSTERWVKEPTSADPHAGAFSLNEAVAGLPLDGKLIAEIRTDFGFFFCDLFADRKPKTVAHFVGLARGKRAWWDASAGAWRKEPLFANASFHRVVPEEMIVAGGVGDGLADVGISLPFEKADTLELHDRKGQLMLIDGGGKFAISDGPNRALDGQKAYSIFGQCYPEDLAFRIARVPQWGAEHDYRPRTRVAVHAVLIRRSETGAQKTRPGLPEGRVQLPEPRGASRGPSELSGQSERLRQDK